MSTNDKLQKYRELFPDDASKAKAFEKIAEQFYAGNFGKMSKADFETLLFSIYIEQILVNGDKNFSRYSDYTLSKELGISQSRVSNLKVKKQLQYPREYKWQESLASISGRTRYENGKIKIQIPDINLYYDIKNAIEEQGGFIEVTLNRGLLVIPLEYYLDLMVAIVDDPDRDELKKCIRDELGKHQKDCYYIESESIGKQIKDLGVEIVISIISNIVSNLDGGGVSIIFGAIKTITKNVINAVKA